MSTFRQCVGKVLIALGASHTSLHLVVINLQLYEFLLMALLYLCNIGLELLESVVSCHGCWGRIGTL